MKTFLLDSGVSLLQDQNNSVIAKLQFTGFEVGSGIGEIVDRDTTSVAGDLLYTADHTSMFITPLHTNEFMVSCEVPKTALEFRPGNILLRCNEGRAFILSISEYAMFKFQTTLTTVGTKLIFNIIINIPGLMDRFDLSNLTQKTATFKEFDTDDLVTRWAWEEPVNQIFVDTDGRTEDPAFVVAVGRNFWSSPFIKDYSEIYETWATKYPWLKTLPNGLLPIRQVHHEEEQYWLGWPRLTAESYESYLEETLGEEIEENISVYAVDNTNGGTIFAQVNTSVTPNEDEVLWQIDDGSGDNHVKIYRNYMNNQIRLIILADSDLILAQNLTIIPDNTEINMAVAFRDTGLAISINGNPVIEVNEALALDILTYEREGIAADDSSWWKGDIITFARFLEPLSNDTLQYLSTPVS